MGELREVEAMSNEEITAIWEAMPGGYAGFLKDWGYLQFARKLIEATEKATPEIEPLNNELRFCIENGTYGPRTGAALRWALEALEAIEAEATP
jgi:hypothetical protein